MTIPKRITVQLIRRATGANVLEIRRQYAGSESGERKAKRKGGEE